MPGPPTALKKALVTEGFEIYRASATQVTLADRVRDNLLMDSGVAVIHGESLAVRVVLRAQASNFPGEGPDGLFARARALSGELTGRGYQEVAADSVPVQDPSDRSRTLDTWHEVSYVLPVQSEAELYVELRFALGLPKNAERS
ncbi:MAG TPA: hypothetical protein VMI54_27520 [Polyangiaceae bacterium]|nr:hypothetical protein [Polyangiaceae bacterium]